tara:strand:- start:801 stop:1130 length:330 start_codon:yes stop_codon:yes gene_type:complete
MAKYQAREWTQADSDAFNKKRAEQLAKLDVDKMSVVSLLGFINSLLDEATKKCEQFNNTADKESIAILKTNNSAVKKTISDRIQAIMEKRNSEKVEQAPEVSRTETASA